MAEKMRVSKTRKPDRKILGEFKNGILILPFNDFIFKTIASRRTPWEESVELAKRVFTGATIYCKPIVAETIYALLLRMQGDSRGDQPASGAYRAWCEDPTQVIELMGFNNLQPSEIKVVNDILFKRVIRSRMLDIHTLSEFGLKFAEQITRETQNFEPMIQIHRKLKGIGETTRTDQIPSKIRSIGRAWADKEGDEAKKQKHLYTSRLAAARVSILSKKYADALDNLTLTGINDPKLVAELTREVWELVLTSIPSGFFPGYFDMARGLISKYEKENMQPMTLDMMKLDFARALMKRGDVKDSSENAEYIRGFSAELMNGMKVLNDGLIVNQLIKRVYGDVSTYVRLLFEHGRKEEVSFAPFLADFFEGVSKKQKIGEAELKTLMFQTFFDEVVSAIRKGQAVPSGILHFMKEESFDITRNDRFLELFNAVIHAALQADSYEPVPNMTGRQYLDELLNSDEVIKLSRGVGSGAYLTLNNQVRLLIAKQRGKLKTLRENRGTIYKRDPLMVAARRVGI